MKLSLNALRVDSYVTQLNENEITEIKGGTSSQCDSDTFDWEQHIDRELWMYWNDIQREEGSAQTHTEGDLHGDSSAHP